MKRDDSYESFLNGFGERLRKAAADPDFRPAPSRSRLVAVAATLAGIAIVGAAATALVLPRSGGLDAVAQARQALEPNGQILHTKITTRRTYPWRERGDAPYAESWVAEGPTRWRTSGWRPLPGFGAEPIEQTAYADGTSYRYFPYYDTLRSRTGLTGELHVTTGLPAGSASATPPTSLPLDPQRDLLPMLKRGRLRDAGKTVFLGRPVRRLQGMLPNHSTYRHPSDETAHIDYFVDAKTFAPVGGLIEYRRTRGSRLYRRTRVQFIVNVYERIPDDAAHADLLKIQAPPKTKVIVRSRQHR